MGKLLHLGEPSHNHGLTHEKHKDMKDSPSERLKPMLRPSTTIQFVDTNKMKASLVEDEVLDIIRNRYDGFILHGATAIWRCYGGHRFSTDLDFITNLPLSQAKPVQKGIREALTSSNYIVQREWYSEMDELLIDPVFSVPCHKRKNADKTLTLHVSFIKNNVAEKIDITFMTARIKYSEVDYLRVDGSKRLVKVLDPETLLKGKLDKYRDKFNPETYKVQDLYDITIIKSRVSTISEHVRKSLTMFLEAIKDVPPKDYQKLHLISGAQIPSFTDMLSSLET